MAHGTYFMTLLQVTFISILILSTQKTSWFCHDKARQNDVRLPSSIFHLLGVVAKWMKDSCSRLGSG
jgi:hypothetical protein